MGSNRHTLSVIARLMGLDEPLPRQPVYKQRRILSETYLRKTASIGLQEKSSFFVGHSSSMNSKKRKAIKDSFSNKSRVEMPQIYADAKQDSVKRSYNSGGSDILLEDLCSDEDNLPKYVQQANKSKRQMLEQRNLTKDFHEVGVDKGSCSPFSRGEVIVIDDLNGRPGYADCKKEKCLWQKDDVRNENKCMKKSQRHYGRVVIPEKKSASRFYKCNPGLSNSLSKSLAFTRKSAGNSFTNFENLHSEPSPCSLSTGDDLSSNSWEASFKQESLNESPQNRLVSLKDTIIDPDSHMNLKEAKQSSPNSVLEPHFKAGKLRNSECYDSPVVDLNSVVKQLKLLETSSEETYSEGSEMAVSSVENTEKGSFHFSRELLGVFSTEESRDFSYLVDVLDEAHLNFEVEFERCNSLESPINPLLFEALEKKYGKQISWLKSERRLLFDRINSWFSEILNSFTDIHIRSKSLKMMFHPTLRRSEVEEELWKLLVNEENEVGKDLSEKALGMETKWLKMEREISIICKEVENYLFDELVAELFCI